MREAAPWFIVIPAAVVGTMAPSAAQATTYMSVAEAQGHFFPAARSFADRTLSLSAAQRKAIGKAAGVSSPQTVKLYEALGAGGRQGWLFVDRVIGKHELITYAVALGNDGAVRGIEILDYRETYGGEVRNARWRAQFVGRRPGQSLALGKDIKNISGATLSSKHITDGVRRLLVTWEMMVAGR